MLLIQETFVNATEGYRFGEGEPYEPYTEDTGKLFRAMQKEYGRCTGHIYIDGPEGTKKVGWVFIKTMQYEDCTKTYEREVWVTLHDAQPETKVTHHYHYLKS